MKKSIREAAIDYSGPVISEHHATAEMEMKDLAKVLLRQAAFEAGAQWERERISEITCTLLYKVKNQITDSATKMLLANAIGLLMDEL
ncbi:MAG TPA: hypothetical protein VGK47_07240 [Nitrososphaeraceae archaeon]